MTNEVTNTQGIWIETVCVPLPSAVVGGFDPKGLWVITKKNEEPPMPLMGSAPDVLHYDISGQWLPFSENTLFFETPEQAERCAKKILAFTKETRSVEETNVTELN